MSSKKEKIVNAAYKIFFKKGYTNTTVTEISTVAGIAYGTVYFYFKKGKDDVLSKILSFIIDDFHELLNEATKMKRVQSKKEVMYKQLISSFKIVDQNRRMMQVFWEAKGKSALIYDEIVRLKEKFVYEILEIIQFNSEGRLTELKNNSLTASAFMHMIWGFIWEYAHTDTYAKEEIVSTVTRLYVEGVHT